MPRRNAQPAQTSPPPSSVRTLKEDDPDAWPLLVAFDLECVLHPNPFPLAYLDSYTLWDLWIDVHPLTLSFFRG
jgi:magnesium-dependent phosphatase 1